MIEKIGDAAKATIDALQGTPLLLTLILLQIGMLAAVLYTGHEIRKAENQRFEIVMRQCGPK